ncbi:hypothetical protein FGG08_005501 [Glutinoglossum americanum]|uniref:Uncharacterized protein n=1 Tax=Glutinoglossum americanum TaxID=1670608 RepID=A0A9P8L1S3_9PEZI|nr:hypothetical protein FGG08_005501 [Glutinoglossum americanum]
MADRKSPYSPNALVPQEKCTASAAILVGNEPKTADRKPPYSEQNALVVWDEESKAIHPLLNTSTALPSDPADISDLRSPAAQSFSLKRVRWLWTAGIPGDIRSLKRHKSLERVIKVTSRMDEHLTWRKGAIHVKELLPFLLDYGYFSKSLCKEGMVKEYDTARGFLLSYAHLIRTEADFKIAWDYGLLPRSCGEISWERWSAFAGDILRQIPQKSLEGRWEYGELQRGRMNFAYRLANLTLHSLYVPDKTYRAIIDLYFSWLVVVVIFIAVVLTAMQVALAAPKYVSERFQKTAYGFSVLCLVGFGLAILIMGFIVLSFFLWNMVVAWQTEIERKRKKSQYGRDV